LIGLIRQALFTDARDIGRRHEALELGSDVWASSRATAQSIELAKLEAQARAKVPPI
jgi:hypothetical protein